MSISSPVETLWFSLGPGLLLSVHRAPVAAIAGHQPSGDEENQIHEPPDPEASERQQLPHSSPRVAQAEAIHSEATQEKRVEQSGYKIVPGVPATAGKRWVRGGRTRGRGLSEPGCCPLPAARLPPAGAGLPAAGAGSYLMQGLLPRRKLRGSAHSMPSSARHCTRVWSTSPCACPPNWGEGGGSGSASAGRETATPPPVTGPEAAAHLDAAVPQLLLRRGVTAVVHGLLALHELLGAAGRDGAVRERPEGARPDGTCPEGPVPARGDLI